MIEQLTNEVYQKLDKEYQKYLNEMSKKTPKEIIENAYPIAIKQELVDMFYEVRHYDKYELQGLLKQEDTLQFLYDTWLDTDGGINNLLEESLEDTIMEVGEECINLIEEKMNNCTEQELVNDMVGVLNDGDKYNLCSSLKNKYRIINSIEAIDVYEIFSTEDGKKYLYNTISNLRENENMKTNNDIEEKILPKLKKLIMLDNNKINKKKVEYER